MNRLVSEDGQLYACGNGLCSEEGIECTNCHYANEAFLKLATYEDTELEPEQIDELNKMLLNDQIRHGRALDKLLEYQKLEKQGLLIKLPCKAGDTVYQINYDRTIENYKVVGFEIDERGKLYVRVLITRPAATIKLSFRKEDLYFTREEAEKALKEMEGKQ